MTTLVLELKKIESEGKINCDIFYSHSVAEATIKESEIDDVFEWIYTTITSNMEKSLEEGSDWITDFIREHNISIPNYNLIAGNSYIQLPNYTIQEKNWLIFKILMITNALNGL